MPSRLHEDLLRLFQNRPTLAAELARQALQARLPEYSEAHLDSANLSDLRPAEYHADLVVLLEQQDVVHGIVVEVQLRQDPDKPFVWPAYACNLRSRIRSPVALLVLAANEAVARWASRTIDLGGDNHFKPWVLGPSAIPEVTDEATAKADPELAVLSAVAHGMDDDVGKATAIAVATQEALSGLESTRSLMYSDILYDAVSEAVRRTLRSMNLPKYEYKTEFAKRYYGQGLAEGKAEGKAEGRAELILRLLSLRFGALPGDAQARIRGATLEELDRIGERLLAAGSLQAALDG